MENQKIIDEINSFCSDKYSYWLTGSSSYNLLNQEIFFSKDQQKIAFIIEKRSNDLVGATVGGIFYPYVHKIYETKYILYIRDLDTQNVFLEIELSPNSEPDFNIDRILFFSDTYDKFIILLKTGVLAGIIYTSKETSQILENELIERYGIKKYDTISHDPGINKVNGQKYNIFKYKNS